MSHQDPSVSHDDQQVGKQASTAMRVLTSEELRAVVGGPEIKNGGAIVAGSDPEIRNGDS